MKKKIDVKLTKNLFFLNDLRTHGTTAPPCTNLIKDALTFRSKSTSDKFTGIRERSEHSKKSKFKSTSFFHLWQ